MNKQAQQSVEYLTTYAWGLLFVIMVVSMFYYSGLFSLNTYFADTCSTGPVLECQEALLLDNGNVAVRLQNRAGVELRITSLTLQGDRFTLSDSNLPLTVGRTNSTILVFNLSETNLNHNELYRIGFSFSFEKTTNPISHDSQGEFVSKAQVQTPFLLEYFERVR
ncbi:MAG: hypothetical protein H6502_05340 [Candidatus Woesearchaeota archaeon]|nr:MAG: hypothetical protein H6502_05340 [Candidatus Woesearchaeota archaeon]